MGNKRLRHVFACGARGYNLPTAHQRIRIMSMFCLSSLNAWGHDFSRGLVSIAQRISVRGRYHVELFLLGHSLIVVMIHVRF